MRPTAASRLDNNREETSAPASSFPAQGRADNLPLRVNREIPDRLLFHTHYVTNAAATFVTSFENIVEVCVCVCRHWSHDVIPCEGFLFVLFPAEGARLQSWTQNRNLAGLSTIRGKAILLRYLYSWGMSFFLIQVAD